MGRDRRLLSFAFDAVQRVLSGSQTVGAAFAVYRDDGSLLMVRSRHASGWGLPAGYRRRGETIEQTAARELLEETGVTAAPGFEIASVVFETAPAHITALVRGRFESKLTGKPSLLKRLEIREIAWFTPEQLADLPLRTGTDELLSRLA